MIVIATACQNDRLDAFAGERRFRCELPGLPSLHLVFIFIEELLCLVPILLCLANTNQRDAVRGAAVWHNAVLSVLNLIDQGKPCSLTCVSRIASLCHGGQSSSSIVVCPGGSSFMPRINMVSILN